MAVLQFKDGGIAERRLFAKGDPLKSSVLPDFNASLGDIFE